MSTESTISGSTRSASDFFATVIGGLETGLTKIGSEVLPNWAAQQLLDQEEDNLYDPTNYATNMTVAQFQALQEQMGTSTTEGPSNAVENVLWDKNTIGTQITAGSILIFLLLGIGGFLIVKKLL